ncbi:hypothetical protein V8E55_005112 [Tylopilus felleus]
MTRLNLVLSAWGPGLIGLAISNFMYGVSLAQSTHYAWFFPKDPCAIKLLVLFVFIADSFHFVGVTELHWNMLVACHRREAAMCDKYLSWGAYIALPMNYAITFLVQCFFCHRVWIITGYKRSVTSAVLLIAVVQLVLGTWVTIETIQKGTIKFLYTTPLVPLAAGVSTVCDIIITVTIFKHLWRSELRGRTNILRDLVVVFVNMGALTCLISLIVGVVYLAQGKRYWVGSPAIIISRCYVNSLLAVLNARRIIRERELRRLRYTIEVPTLSTIR